MSRNLIPLLYDSAFSALRLLVRQQKKHLAQNLLQQSQRLSA